MLPHEGNELEVVGARQRNALVRVLENVALDKAEIWLEIFRRRLHLRRPRVRHHRAFQPWTISDVHAATDPYRVALFGYKIPHAFRAQRVAFVQAFEAVVAKIQAGMHGDPLNPGVEIGRALLGLCHEDGGFR